MRKQLNKEQVKQLYRQARKQNSHLVNIPKYYEQRLRYFKQMIKKEMKGFSLFAICGRDEVNYFQTPYFERAVATLNLQQKVALYSKFVQHLKQALRRQDPFLESPCTAKKDKKQSFNLLVLNSSSRWQLTYIEVTNFELYSKSNLHLYLTDYILRKSKRKDRVCFALEAYTDVPPQTLRFSFNSIQDEEKYYPLIEEKVNKANLERVIQHIKDFNQQKNIIQKQIFRRNNVEENKDQSYEEMKQVEEQSKQESNCNVKQFTNSPLSESIKKQVSNPENKEQIQNEQFRKLTSSFRSSKKQTIKHKNSVFQQVFPEYKLNELPIFQKYRLIYESKGSSLAIYQSYQFENQFKLSLFTSLSPEKTIHGIADAHLFSSWHPQVLQSNTKMRLQSQNSCIQFQQHKPFSKWFYPRLFTYLAYLFRKDGQYYLIKRSVDPRNFPLQNKKERGEFQKMVCRSLKTENGSHLVIQIQINHGRYLNKKQSQDLTIKFLKGFEHLQPFLQQKQNQNLLSKDFDLQWQVDETIENEWSKPEKKSFTSSDFMSQIQESVDQATVFYTIDQQQKKSIPDLNENSDSIIYDGDEMFEIDEEIIKLNREGLILLPKEYLKRKHNQKILYSEYNPIYVEYRNVMLKNDWEIMQKGGLKLISQEKINAQDSVFKFILKTLKNNFFSGRSILHISLPVDIFNTDSYIQRTCVGLGLAPTFLEKAAVTSDPVERFKYCLAFGYTFTVLCFDVEKPFNPILGETYQGYIRGCPVYAEQISHHPPISSYLMMGRGYRAYGSIQAVAKIHINSGEGINNGWNTIEFDNGEKVIFQTPPGELYGLAIGYRGFKLKDKGIYADEKNNLFFQMNFEESLSFFSKRKWSYGDQIDGQLHRVTPKFLERVVKQRKFQSPTEKEIEQSYFKLSGRWAEGLTVDGQVIYDVQKHLPDNLIDEPYPLNSNSKYRQDLFYRKQRDNQRSQAEKERIENIQREDRKLRERCCH